MMTTDEMEQPAKQYQIAAIEQELKQVNHKLDTLIDSAKGYVTQDQLATGMKEVREYADSKLTVMEERYAPIYKLFWALITAIVVEAAVSVFIMVSK